MVNAPCDLRHPPYAGTAIITGAGHGIGRELAATLAHCGQRLLLVDQDPQGLEATCAALSGSSTQQAIAGDVTDPDLVGRVLEHAGADLSAVYLLAGTIHVGTAAATADVHARRVIETNLLAPLTWAHRVLKAGRLRRGGRLVLASSAFGVLPVAGYSAYAASKAGVAMLAQVLALEAPDAHVHYALLGGVRTGIMTRGSYAPSVDAHRVQERFLGRVARTTPQQAAQQILRGADRGHRRIVVGADARLVCAMQRLSPTIGRAASQRLFSTP